MFQKTLSVLNGRMIQKASVSNEGMSQPGNQTTRTNPVKEPSGLSLHAQRSRQRTPLSIDRAAERTWFNEARAPHLAPSVFKSFYLKRLYSIVIESFYLQKNLYSFVIGFFVFFLPYLRESPLDPVGSLTTRIYIYIYWRFLH